MRFRKSLLVVAAAALPLASVTLLEGTAVAGGTVGTGTPTCAFGGTITFNPPLSVNGTAGAKKEVTTVAANTGSCSSGSPVPSGSVVTVKPIKTKPGTKGANAGKCSDFASGAGAAKVKVKIAWTNVKKSSFSIQGLSEGVNPGTGEVGFTKSGFTVKGSYATTNAQLAVYLTTSDSAKIASCVGGTYSGSISTLTIDESNSSATL